MSNLTDIELTGAQQTVLDLVAAYQLIEAEPAPLKHVLLEHPPHLAQSVKITVKELFLADCLEVGGFENNETLLLTPSGLLRCGRHHEASALAESLLLFFKRRLKESGIKFQSYQWPELTEAGVVTTDKDFPLFLAVVQTFELNNSAAWSKDNPSAASWGVPSDIVEFRSLSDIRGLYDRVQERRRRRADELREMQNSHIVTARGIQELYEPEMMKPVEPDTRKVFIIHGRNIAARTAVEHFLRALGLQPMDFDQLAADQGGTEFIGNIVRAGLGQAQGIVALFTPEEYAALRPDHRGTHDSPADIQRWQARPNVIFEAGMAYGMAPKRTVLVTLGSDVSLFSDVAGIHVVRLGNDPASRGRLRQKLLGMGCEIDQRTDAWIDPARSGDFEACMKQLQGVSPRDPF